jgi:glyoxylase-like metal-dependent hydrolase (beta-lactamase superfamily II)
MESTEIRNYSTDLKLYPMITGYVKIEGTVFYDKKDKNFRSEDKTKRFVPVPAYLVIHPVKGAILIDTGFHSSNATKNYSENWGWFMSMLINIGLVNADVDTGMDVVSQMKKTGIKPEDLKYVIMSHLTADHSSGLPHLSNVTILAGEGEWEASQKMFAMFDAYISKHFEGNFKVEYIPYSKFLGIEPFEHVVDLFGDGSIWLISTSGHSTGHQSILLNMRSGPALIAVDAVHTKRNLEQLIPPGVYQNKEKALKSLKSIKSFIGRYPNVFIFYGHDVEFWKKVKTLPQFYE